MNDYNYPSQGLSQPSAYLSPAPNARAASIYDTNPEHHGVTIDPNEIFSNAPQGFRENHEYDDNNSDYVDDDDDEDEDDADDRSYFDVGPASGYAGRMYGNGLNGTGMREDDMEEEEIDLSRRPSIPRNWQRRGSIGGKGLGFIKRIPSILNRRRKHTTTLMPHQRQPEVYTPLGPPAPPSIRSHYSDLPEMDGQHHQQSQQASGSLHSHPSQHEDLQSPASYHSHHSYPERHGLVAVNGDPQQETLVSPTTAPSNAILVVPGEERSPGQASMRHRRTPSASVPSIQIDAGSSPARSAYHTSTQRSRSHSTRASSKSSHPSRAQSQRSHTSDSTIVPANSLQHLMHHHTSAPASRTPSVYPPAQAYHEMAPHTPLGQLARKLDNVFSMPWHDHDQVADVYVPEISSSRSHTRVAEAAASGAMAADKRREEETVEALAMHGQSWYYPSKAQVLKRMRKRALGSGSWKWGAFIGNSGGANASAGLARGASNASSAQYLLAPAYGYGDGYVAPRVPRSQPSVSLHTAMSPNLTTSPPGSYGFDTPPVNQHQVYAYAAPAPYPANQYSGSTY